MADDKVRIADLYGSTELILPPFPKWGEQFGTTIVVKRDREGREVSRTEHPSPVRIHYD